MSTIRGLADGLAERLGIPVGIDDRQFRSIAYSSHADEIDPVRRMSILGRQAPERVVDWLLTLGVARSSECVRVPANPELHMVSRVCFPLRFHDRLLGYLWLAEKEASLSDSQLSLAAATSGAMAGELYRLELAEHNEHRLEAETVRALTEAGSQLAPSDAAASVNGPCRTVAVIDVVGVDEHDADVRLQSTANRVRRSLPPRHALALVERTRAIVVLAGTESDLDCAASRLLSSAEIEFDDLPQARPVVGLGTARSSPNESQLPDTRPSSRQGWPTQPRVTGRSRDLLNSRLIS